jgi:hypothetical protein
VGWFFHPTNGTSNISISCGLDGIGRMTRVRIFVEVRRVGNNVDILQITIRKSIIIPNINQAMKNDQLHSNHGDKSTGDDVHTAIRVVWVLILPAEILVLVLLKYRSSKPIQLVMMT